MAAKPALAQLPHVGDGEHGFLPHLRVQAIAGLLLQQRLQGTARWMAQGSVPWPASGYRGWPTAYRMAAPAQTAPGAPRWPLQREGPCPAPGQRVLPAGQGVPSPRCSAPPPAGRNTPRPTCGGPRRRLGRRRGRRPETSASAPLAEPRRGETSERVRGAQQGLPAGAQQPRHKSERASERAVPWVCGCSKRGGSSGRPLPPHAPRPRQKGPRLSQRAPAVAAPQSPHRAAAGAWRPGRPQPPPARPLAGSRGVSLTSCRERSGGNVAPAPVAGEGCHKVPPLPAAPGPLLLPAGGPRAPRGSCPQGPADASPCPGGRSPCPGLPPAPLPNQAPRGRPRCAALAALTHLLLSPGSCAGFLGQGARALCLCFAPGAPGSTPSRRCCTDQVRCVRWDGTRPRGPAPGSGDAAWADWAVGRLN